MQASEVNAGGSRFNLSRWALAHAPLVRYLMVAFMLLGAAAYFQLGQDEDPPFTFRAMVVRAWWPGASAQQLAEQVTDKLERALQEVPYADKIVSYSKPGETTITFQLKDHSPARDVPQIWYTVRKKIGDMRATLPQGVIGPYFNDDFGDVYGVIYALQSGGGFSKAEMKTIADDVRRELLRVKDVAKVEIFGAQDEKIYIEVSQKRLAELGLDMNAVLAQLGQQNAVVSAGSVETALEVAPVRVSGAFGSVQALRDMPIRGPSGRQLRLQDIARVRRGYVEPPQVKVRHDGNEVIALGVSMAKGGDIIALGKALKEAAARIESTLPAGMTLQQVQDQPAVVAGSVNEFVRVLVEAVAVVLGVSFLSLGLHKRPGGPHPLRRRWVLDARPGLVVGITIPAVLAITFLLMYYWGIGLHKVSLGSLIIALGLLVDDAIIAVEMMVRKMEEGYDRLRAATFAYELTAMPMLTGTLITATGFLPIGIAKSTVGEYTFAIFAVTVIALLVSWVASVIFVPLLGTWLLKTPPHVAHARENAIENRRENTLENSHENAAENTGELHDNFNTPFYMAFRRLVAWCVRRRWLTIGATALVFALGMAGMGRVQQQFFPDSTRPEILVSLWLPEGASFAATEDVATRVEKRIRQAPGAASVSVWIGSGVPRFYLPLNQIMPQSNVAQLIVLSQDMAARNHLLGSLPALLAQEFPEARARVKLLSSGPPVDYPVQFRVIGPDPQQLRAYANEVKAALRANAHMRDVNDNWNESIKTLRLQIDQAKARALGVSSQSIAQALHVMQNGAAVGQYREGDKLIDITLRQPASERGALDSLAGAYVATASGKAIPLAQIATPVLAWEPGVMWRDKREYAITVQGDVARGMEGATVTAQLLPALRELQARWASQTPGYRLEVAGATEESSKGSASIAAGVPVMLFITFTLLMLQLQSFSRAMLVFLTGPLGIAGVAAALLALNRPFGFVALLGVIALMGMIQRNSVILIDQIELNRRHGMSASHAIVEAAVGRLRPIALTAAAAVLAMIPLSRSVFWGPMAVAIMGGLIVATALTLLALPAMYAAWFRVKAEPEGASP